LDNEVKTEKIEAEYTLTLEKACSLLGVDPKTHWIRVTHEITRDAPPWAVVRLQALKR
jgi:hypothetical protein